MKPIELAKDVYWVGAIDWNVRDFHGYSTYEGTTYNAFLIMDEKVTLVDTVKADHTDQLFGRISSVVDPKKIDMVVSNHTEMDHSGGLPRIMHRIGEDKPVYCSKMGYKNLQLHFGKDLNYHQVEDGGELSLGKRNLMFLETRMLHWPDSMFSYLKEDGILFSSDAFGQHYASLERFDDTIREDIWPHALKYYANILLPYSHLVTKLVEKVGEAGLEFSMICPDHGILWRKDPMSIVKAYATWAEQKPKKEALVIYDTMWHSTEAMAESIVEGLHDSGVPAKPLHLRKWHRSDVMTMVVEAGIIAVGSPTINNGIFPTVADFLTYMKGLKPKNKVGVAFGSYGWSGEAPRIIQGELEQLGFTLADPLKIHYVPGEDGLASSYALGQQLAKAYGEAYG
ncbi:MAG: FprA family A-type flavoprotein [Desulfatibacillaceae bacterium]